MYFLNINNATLGVIIESSAFEKMGADIDLSGNFVELTRSKKRFVLALNLIWVALSSPRTTLDIDIFTIESSSDDSGKFGDRDLYTDEELVVVIDQEIPDHTYFSHYGISYEDESLDLSTVFVLKVNYLPPDVFQQLNDMLRDMVIRA